MAFCVLRKSRKVRLSAESRGLNSVFCVLCSFLALSLFRTCKMGMIPNSIIEEATESVMKNASFLAKGIYVKKLCWGTFCPFGNR